MTTTAPWNDRVRRRLRLRDVDILLAVIESGSMGKAAGVLNMSQPAISKSIAYLEHTLGVRLLDRSRQGVEATPYGRALVKRGVAMFDELRQGVHDIASLTDPTAGEVRMGGSEHTIAAIYAPVIRRFSPQYPRMSFHVAVGDLRTQSRALEARDIDFVVSRMYGPPSEEHAVEVLFEDPLVAVTAPNNPLARRRKTSTFGHEGTSPPDSRFPGAPDCQRIPQVFRLRAAQDLPGLLAWQIILIVAQPHRKRDPDPAAREPPALGKIV